MIETLVKSEMSPAEITTERLLDDLKALLGQGELFEDDSWTAEARRKLVAENPDKLIIPASILERFRYTSAVRGAGFEYGDEPSGHSLMWDEVSQNEAFVPREKGMEYEYYAKSYVGTEAQVREVLHFDYVHLKGLSEGGFQLLYEEGK